MNSRTKKCRSIAAIEKRRSKRSLIVMTKRRNVRASRASRHNEHQVESEATAQAGTRHCDQLVPRLDCVPKSLCLKLGTLSVQDIRSIGKREEVEYWMSSMDVQVLATQETRVNSTQKELKKGYSWFFSTGPNHGYKNFSSGVGSVIKNSFMKYVIDINPLDDRIIVLQLNHEPPICMISAYAPTSAADLEKKGHFYAQLDKVVATFQKSHVLYLLGDFNARVLQREPTYANNVGPHILISITQIL